mgnify:CR=1 FL=1
MTCRPSRDVALELSDGALLPPEHQVKLVQRLINGKLVDNPNASYLRLSGMELNKTNNGKANVSTMADKVADVWRSAKAEMDALDTNGPPPDDDDDIFE